MTVPAWPRVLLAGAPKCGTTALHSALEASGAFRIVWRKELFALNDPGFWMPPAQGGYPVHGLGCYSALGIPGDTVFVDGCTTYLYQETAPSALAHAHDEGLPFLVVFVLRDPVDRIVSNYRYFKHILGRDVGAASLDEYAHRLLGGQVATGNHQVDQALDHSRYAQYLRRWTDALPGDRLLVLDSDAVRADVKAVAHSIVARAGLNGPVAPRARVAARGNESYLPRWPWLHQQALRLGERVPYGPLRRVGTALYHRFMGAWAESDADELSPDLRHALETSLAPDAALMVSLMPTTSGWPWVSRLSAPGAIG